MLGGPTLLQWISAADNIDPPLGRLKLLSWNVNGLGDRIKRGIVLQYLKRQTPDLVLLQETHIQGISYCALNRWGYKLQAHAGYTRGSRGVGILVRSALPFQVQKVTRDPLGRFVSVSGR